MRRRTTYPAFVLCALALSFLVVPAASAQVTFPYWGPILSCTGAAGTPGGLPQCSSVCDILSTAQRIIYFGMTLLFLGIAPVLFIWGGVMILIAGASPSRLETGKKILWGTLIGLAIGLGAFLIIATFLWGLNVAIQPAGLGGVAWPNIQCTAP